MARLKNYESSKEQGSRKNLNTPSSKWNLRDNYRQSNMTWQWAIKMGRGFQWSDMANKQKWYGSLSSPKILLFCIYA